MTRSLFTKIAASVTATATALSLSACASDSENTADADTIQVGTSPGPYSELFKDGIEPSRTVLNRSSRMKALRSITPTSLNYGKQTSLYLKARSIST